MPFTKAQLHNIMMHRGQAYVAPNRLPYSGRVAETYLRRKIYRLEDRAALAEFRLVQEAARDIREYGLRLSSDLGISELGYDAKSITWQRNLKGYIGTRLNSLSDQIAYNAYKWNTLAYAASYYGRQWLVASMFPQRETAHKRLNSSEVSIGVLKPLQEAFDADGAIYLEQGNEWRDNYRMAVGLSTLKAQRSLTTKSTPQSPLTALQGISALLGTQSKPGKATSGLYAATSLLTRTAVMRSSNQAAAQSYQLNISLIPGLVWITSRDTKVCPMCVELDGTIYPLAGLGLLILLSLPPDGSHYGCRCSVAPTLVPTLEHEASDQPPEDSFEEWVWAYGVGNELYEFFSDDLLESTQL